MKTHSMYPIHIRVNGINYALEVEAQDTLLTILRDKLDITGPKECCGVGECGACTVLIDGKAVNSCLVLAVEMDGHDIVTVEGLGEPGKLSTLQEAFIEAGAIQCGFCTPGMIMAAQYLLNNNPHPTEEDVRTALSGNLCRCTGYSRIITAVLSVANNGER
jgi:carbon-monoxide dehydrogenase small subunit